MENIERSDWLTKMAEFFSSVCLLCISGLVITQVGMRYIFNYPFIWSEELTTIFFGYLAFSGIGAAYAQRKHLYVDALLSILPKRVLRVVNPVVIALSVIFLLIVSFEMIHIMIVSLKMEIVTTALRLPMLFVYLPLPIGCTIFCIQIVRRFFKCGNKRGN